MSVNYKDLPDYGQFIQSYFVDQEMLKNQDVGTVLIQTAEAQSGTDTANNNNNNNNTEGYSG